MMGRKLNLSHLTEEECERILQVLQKDYEIRQAEKDRIGSIENTLKQEQTKAEVLSQQNTFNKNCCIRCFKTFGFIFNRRRQCYVCGYSVCKECCTYQSDSKNYVCHLCNKEEEFNKQTCSWFYDAAGQKYRRFGSAKVVRSLYKTNSYCKLRYAATQGGLKTHKISTCCNSHHKKNKTIKHNSDTEVEAGQRMTESQPVSDTGPGFDTGPGLSDSDHSSAGDGQDEDKLSATDLSANTRLPSLSRIQPASRAGSLDTLNLLSSQNPAAPSRPRRARTPDPSRSLRTTDLGKDRSPDSNRPHGGKWNHERQSRETLRKENKDIYKHAFDSARKAEETKFKAKFDILLNDLHRTLSTQSPHGLTDSFASTSYGEVVLSFRGRVKDLVIGFSQRLQLAYESFESQDNPDEHNQKVKQHVSRFLEDLLGESLDLTSDEAVSDLSSLSDDSGNDRHVFEDQIAQAVVSKILENHRKEARHPEDYLHSHLSSPSLIPDAFNNDDDDQLSPAVNDVDVKDTDISKDFEDLKRFVQETQSRSRQYDDTADGGKGLEDTGQESERSANSPSTFSTSNRDRDFLPLPDFTQFDHIDFNSGELDPDLLQMNLAVIPEETEEELEEEASDTHWRENWIFKGQAPPAGNTRKRINGHDDQPQYMMVPKPDDGFSPRVGNRDADQLSDLSDNEDLTDDDDSFYPRTSEELQRISRHKRSPTSPSLSSPSLIPSTGPFTNHQDSMDLDNSLQRRRKTSSSPASSSYEYLDFEDVAVGTEDFVGPIVEPSNKELKLLEELVPADGDDPKFLAQPESVTIQEGEPVKLSCQVAGTQPTDVFWYREQDEVEELEENEDIEFQEDGDRHLATLYNVGKQHAGQYMCIALSDKGKAIKYFTVTVKDNKQELKKPEFLKELKDVEVLEGQSVKFRCKVKGYPQPRITWYKDGNLLKSDKSCRIEKFGNRDYILTIDYATMDDDAEYMVMAKNVAGMVKSTAQVIVEPYSDGHPLLSKSRSPSVSTVYTDSESDRPSSTQPDDSLIHRAASSREPSSSRPRPNDNKVDSLVSKVTATRNNMRLEAEGMLTTAEELTALNLHLEDMERHLDSMEGRNFCGFSHKQKNTDAVDLSTILDENTAFRLIEDEKKMKQAARNVRQLTSNALSVLQVAEEIIQRERNATENNSPASSPPDRYETSTLFPSLHEQNNNKTGTFAGDFSQSDLNKSMSSGYETYSMSSSAMDDTDREMAGSLLSRPDLSPQQEEIPLYLPPLDEDFSGSYREEVSISLTSTAKNKTNNSASTESSLSPVSTASLERNLYPPNSVSSASSVKNSPVSVASRQAVTVCSRTSVPVSEDEPDSRLAQPQEIEDGKLVINFGPKEVSSTAYGRDYVVKSGKGGEEKKHWSVTLDPFCPTADVVNRQHSLQEAEEQIYLTAGKMFHLEDRVKELQTRVESGDSRVNERSLTALEDQVARTAAQVARSETDVSNIESTVNNLQSSQHSPRGSHSSSNSTPRVSIDSGVSSFTPERLERPQPVHMVGHTQEEEMPESRAEYDADSGIELPSVSRLRAMFGASGKDELSTGEGNFKRIHSITARSLSKDQLQKLRQAGNTTVADVIRIKDQPTSTRSASQSPGKSRSPDSSQGTWPQAQADLNNRTSSAISVSLLTDQQQKTGPVSPRQIRITNLPEPAQYQQLDPNHQPVLIYPELEGQEGSSSFSSSRNSPVTGRKSMVLNSLQPSPNSSRPASSQVDIPRGRAVHASGGQDATPIPKIRSGCISARAAFWERRIMQGETNDTNVEEEFPEMVQDSEA